MNDKTRPETIRSPSAHPLLSLGVAALLTVVLHLPAVRADETAAGKRLPAFPGAEGFGVFSRGGREGEVHVVTNLNGRGPGSIRQAVEAEGARIVVFAVGGTIDLGGPLAISSPYCTIAGQTAPGGGITLKNGSLVLQADHLIVRYIRCRLGEQAGDAGEVDAVSIYCPPDKNNPDRPVASDVILDHVSASWGTDEVLSVTGAVDHRLIQDVRAGTGKVIRAVAEVGGWPELAPGTAPVDTDQDGMPDAWEKSHGLSPADAGDSRLDADHDGYTNIEEYLNWTDPTEYVDYWVTATK